MREMRSPLNIVRAILIIPPCSFLASINPKMRQTVNTAILETNITLALEPTALKKRYSNTAQMMPAIIPKIQIDFCIPKIF